MKGVKNFYIGDVPPGTYNITLADNCGSINRTITITAAPPAFYDIGDNRIKYTTDCVGGISKGKIVFEPTYNVSTVSNFNTMSVYKDLDNGQAIHLRAGNLIESKTMTEVPNPDPSKRSYRGEIGNFGSR